MMRQLLVGHFGYDDSFDPVAGLDEQITSLQLVASKQTLDYGIGHALSSLNNIGIFPTEMGIDLLVLAAHVHAADTRISRVEQSQDSWTREIRLIVPVSNPSRWYSAAPS